MSRALIRWETTQWVVEIDAERFNASTLRAAIAVARNSRAVPVRIATRDTLIEATVLDHEAGDRWENVPAARAGETHGRYLRRLVRWAMARDSRLAPCALAEDAAVVIYAGDRAAYLTVRA